MMPITDHLLDVVSATSQMQALAPSRLLWSLTRVSETLAIVRIAAMETEDIKLWLYTHLIHLHRCLSEEVFKLAFQ
jgi:hypothetical protein